MASWYSHIYVFVREYRASNPITGYILHLLLNIMLIVQIGGVIYGYWCYIVICQHWFTSGLQITIYMILYNSILFMALWSLTMTVITPVSRIPGEYYVDLELDKKLKACTPKTGDRYFPDHSTAEQVQEQKKLLEGFASAKGLTFVEQDHFERLRYCYQCSLVKPDRAHHCSSCGFCVLKFDHHCPWINKCVSHRNYKYFLLYLFYGTAICLFDLITSIESIVQFALSSDKSRSDNWDLFACVCFSMCFHAVCSYFPLGQLLCYHAKLVYDNETTCEQAKFPVIRSDPHASYNITAYLNYRSVFGWGLWAFPVPTFVSDGCHFHVRYSEDHRGERAEVVPVTPPISSRSKKYDPAAGDVNNNK